MMTSQVAFTSIPGSELTAGILEAAASFLETEIWTSTDPWLRWDDGGSEFYDWTSEATEAIEYGLFDTTNPVVSYEELGSPFLSTIWSMCQGLVHQVHFTLPMDPTGTTPKGLGAQFNPTGSKSTTVNLTYTEDWVQDLLQTAYKHSPLFWHHSTRHTPSDRKSTRLNSSH